MEQIVDRDPENHVAILTDAIIREILVGSYPPGAKLKEAELAERFGVGRSVLREALRRIEERGIAKAIANAGMSVVRIGRREFIESSMARRALEEQTAAHAALSIDEAGLERLRDLIHRQEANMTSVEAKPRVAGHAATDRNFHRTIAEASGNTFILRLLENNILHVSRLFQMEHPNLADRADAALVEHKEIAAAIAQRDPEVAQLKMRRHLTRSMEWYLQELDRTVVPKKTSNRGRRLKGMPG